MQRVHRLADPDGRRVDLNCDDVPGPDRHPRAPAIDRSHWPAFANVTRFEGVVQVTCIS
jgi:hypothetical protein